MKTGIYIDASNISLSGGYAMRYDILDDFIMYGSEAIRRNTYLAYDSERAATEIDYRNKQQNYFNIIQRFGYTVIRKEVKVIVEDGERKTVSNSDMDIAIDMMVQSQGLDRLILLSGDGDFCKVVEALRNMGKRVEVMAFRNVSRKLAVGADSFTSGFVVPNLAPIKDQEFESWGELGSRVRGVCYEVNHMHTFAFLRYMDLDYNYQPAFVHFSELPKGYAPKHGNIYEFELDKNEKGIMAKNVKFIC